MQPNRIQSSVSFTHLCATLSKSKLIDWTSSLRVGKWVSNWQKQTKKNAENWHQILWLQYEMFLLDPKKTFWTPKQSKTRHSITVYESVSVVSYLYSPCQSMNPDRPFQYLFERNMLEEMRYQHRQHSILWMIQKSRHFGLQQRRIVTMCYTACHMRHQFSHVSDF